MNSFSGIKTRYMNSMHVSSVKRELSQILLFIKFHIVFDEFLKSNQIHAFSDIDNSKKPYGERINSTPCEKAIRIVFSTE